MRLPYIPEQHRSSEALYLAGYFAGLAGIEIDLLIRDRHPVGFADHELHTYEQGRDAGATKRAAK